MPTYEYSCPRCGRFDHFQRISEPPLESCPQCGARPRRLISGSAGIMFKGSGFFLTDYHDARAGWATGAKGEAGQTSSGPEGGKGGAKEGPAAFEGSKPDRAGSSAGRGSMAAPP
ncbi:MAG: hypothetical protein K6T75_03500 [Acetobacteraceae bacterium]|nr:hypothetical protein [Acetobacteraceae bacterium]